MAWSKTTLLKFQVEGDIGRKVAEKLRVLDSADGGNLRVMAWDCGRQ